MSVRSNLYIKLKQDSLELELNSFEEYIIDIRKNIITHQESLLIKFDRLKTKYPDLVDDLHEDFKSPMMHYYAFYPSTFNNSTLLLLYTLFESSLKNICDLFKNDYKKQLKDLKGQNYIEKSKRYLTKVVGIDLSEFEDIWHEITFIQKLKNCIIHNNANIVRKPHKPIQAQSMYKRVINNQYLNLNEESGIITITNDQFLLDTLELIRKYLMEILGKLSDSNVKPT